MFHLFDSLTVTDGPSLWSLFLLPVCYLEMSIVPDPLVPKTIPEFGTPHCSDFSLFLVVVVVGVYSIATSSRWHLRQPILPASSVYEYNSKDIRYYVFANIRYANIVKTQYFRKYVSTDTDI